MKIAQFAPRYLDSFPRPLEEGVLYISRKFSMAGHHCACGCGQEVMTPLKPTQWSLSESPSGDVTLYPSIGNWGFPCRSHYWIRRNKVVWSYEMTESEIELNRRRDQATREAYYEQRNKASRPASADQKSKRLLDWIAQALSGGRK
ncbi:MAG: DUF6527 family protein [Pseudomonadota bacterium]